MGFKKGDPRPPNAGRKKGQKNKKRVPLVTEYLAARGINPAAEIVKLIPTLEAEQQTKAWQNLLGHTQPRVTENISTQPASPAVSEAEAPSAQLLSIVKPKPTPKAEGGN